MTTNVPRSSALTSTTMCCIRTAPTLMCTVPTSASAPTRTWMLVVGMISRWLKTTVCGSDWQLISGGRSPPLQAWSPPAAGCRAARQAALLTHSVVRWTQSVPDLAMPIPDLASRLRALQQSGALTLPAPGTGNTVARHMALLEFGRMDLSLARLAEAHTDALAILAEAGRSSAAQSQLLYGVWAS